MAAAHPEDLGRAVAPLTVDGRVFDTDARPAVMGVVNLSRDSTYRESVAPSASAAVRKGRVMAAQGADIVDVGAESTDATHARVEAETQIRQLVPVVEALAGDGLLVSTESYEVSVVRAVLDAGARVVNLTGSTDDDAVFELAAEYGAAVVLCHVDGPHARDLDSSSVDTDPVPEMLSGFASRIERARALGVPALAIDPGVGFGFGASLSAADRAARQTSTILNSFRLRRLGVPICQSVPHAFDLFEDEFRIAESFFTVLARLGGAGLVRTHEVSRVVAVLRAMAELPVEP
jgi:dihydropteroate synthase